MAHPYSQRHGRDSLHAIALHLHNPFSPLFSGEVLCCFCPGEHDPCEAASGWSEDYEYMKQLLQLDKSRWGNRAGIRKWLLLEYFSEKEITLYTEKLFSVSVAAQCLLAGVRSFLARETFSDVPFQPNQEQQFWVASVLNHWRNGTVPHVFFFGGPGTGKSAAIKHAAGISTF